MHLFIPRTSNGCTKQTKPSEDNKSSTAISSAEKINRNTQANSWPSVHVENYIKDSKVWKTCAVWLLTASLQTDDLISRLHDGIWELFSTQFIRQPGKRLLKTFQLKLFCFVLVSRQCLSPWSHVACSWLNTGWRPCPYVWVHKCVSLTFQWDWVREVLTTLQNTSSEDLSHHSAQL